MSQAVHNIVETLQWLFIIGLGVYVYVQSRRLNAKLYQTQHNFAEVVKMLKRRIVNVASSWK